MNLDVRGHTVRQDGKIVATLTYSNGYTSVCTPEGTVIGRFTRVHQDPELFYAWDAKHPAAWTPSDDQLTHDVTQETAIAAILARYRSMQRHHTKILFSSVSRDYPGVCSTLITSRGYGDTHADYTLADLLALKEALDLQIERMTVKWTDEPEVRNATR